MVNDRGTRRVLVIIGLLTGSAILILFDSIGVALANTTPSPQGSSNAALHWNNKKTPVPSPTGGSTVSVFFTGPSGPTAVTRTTALSAGLDVETYALQELIAGPSLPERTAGLRSAWGGKFVSPSSCNTNYEAAGPDFLLTLDMKGLTPLAGNATVQICRGMTLDSDTVSDPNVADDISSTLKQFSGIMSVTITDQDGACWPTDSMNACLN